MKLLKKFSIVGIACVILFSSCGGSEEKTSDTARTSDTTRTADSTATTAKPASNINTTPETIMALRFKVANFSRWKAIYDQNDSLRQAFGLHNYVIGRGAEDSGMVLVAIKADDITKAKAFVKDDRVKANMKKAGVMGAPLVMLDTIFYQDMAADMSDRRALMNFTVKDWDTWKKSFDGSTQVRKDNGLRERVYGHDVDDNHKVTLVLGIDDTAKANSFWKSDLVKQRRAEGGVTGEVKRFIYHVVQKYSKSPNGLD